MKLNLLSITTLLCGLLLLGSCAKDEPRGAIKKDRPDDGPRVSVALDLDVAIGTFAGDQPAPQTGRAFTSAQTPITVKDGKKSEVDDDYKPTGVMQKILSIARDQFIKNNPTADVLLKLTYYNEEGEERTELFPLKMVYEEKRGCYRLKGSLPLPQDAVEYMKKYKDTALPFDLYMGGSSYDATSNSLRVGSVMQEVSLSSLASTPINLPIPYTFTSPASITLKEEGGIYVLTWYGDGEQPLYMTPQGSLLLVTFRNNMKEDVTFDGITAISNSFICPREGSSFGLSLDDGWSWSGNRGFISPYNYPTKTSIDGVTGFGYDYYSKTFSSPQYTVAKGGALSDKALLFWGINPDWRGEIAGSVDITPHPGVSLIHVYAKNAKIGGREITRPDYHIAPIGGASFDPWRGRAYTLNCEFYEQPRQALGYLDKGYLYKDVTWKHHEFDGAGSRDPDTYATAAMRAVPLASATEAGEVLSGAVTTSKGKMRVMNRAWLNLTSLLYPIEFMDDLTSSTSSFKDGGQLFGKGKKGYDYRVHHYWDQLPYKATNDDASEFSVKGFYCTDYIRKDQRATAGEPATAYRQLYVRDRAPNPYPIYSPYVGRHYRSPYQTVMRYRTKPVRANVGIYANAIVMESLYLGKYFFGNVMTTPLYVGEYKEGTPFRYVQDDEVFDSPQRTDRVSRVLISADRVNGVSESDLLKPYAEVRQMPMVHAYQFFHWGDVPKSPGESRGESWESSAMRATSVSDLLARIETFSAFGRTVEENRFYSYRGYAGGYVFNRAATASSSEGVKIGFRNHSYQALRAYSTKYQGNDGFRNNAN